MRKQKKMMLMVMAAQHLLHAVIREPKQEMVQSESTQKQSTEEKKNLPQKSQRPVRKLACAHALSDWKRQRGGIDAWVQSVTEQYPDIEIEVQAVTPWAQFACFICKRIATGDAPRIFYGETFSSLFNWQGGRVLDLTGQVP